MLEDFRPGDIAVFGDVPDEDHRNARRLGKTDEFGGTLANLRNAARSRIDIVRMQRLDRVDDDYIGFDGPYLSKNVLCIGFRQDVAMVVPRRYPLCPHLDLLLAFFARYIKRFERKFK